MREGKDSSPISPGKARRYSAREKTRTSLRYAPGERSEPSPSRNRMSTDSGSPGLVRTAIPPLIPPWEVMKRATGNGTTSRSRTSIAAAVRSEEHTSELQSRFDLVCRLLLEQKKHTNSR